MYIIPILIYDFKDERVLIMLLQKDLISLFHKVNVLSLVMQKNGCIVQKNYEYLLVLFQRKDLSLSISHEMMVQADMVMLPM